MHLAGSGHTLSAISGALPADPQPLKDNGSDSCSTMGWSGRGRKEVNHKDDNKKKKEEEKHRRANRRGTLARFKNNNFLPMGVAPLKKE